MELEGVTGAVETAKTVHTKTHSILSFLAQMADQEKDLVMDADEIVDSLIDRGYSTEDIQSAFSHLEKQLLRNSGAFWSHQVPSYRTYDPVELSQISPAARGYLWRLKCQGVVDHALEDEIIYKVMARPERITHQVHLQEIKTVAALTLFGYEHKSSMQQNPHMGQHHLN